MSTKGYCLCELTNTPFLGKNTGSQLQLLAIIPSMTPDQTQGRSCFHQYMLIGRIE